MPLCCSLVTIMSLLIEANPCGRAPSAMENPSWPHGLRYVFGLQTWRNVRHNQNTYEPKTAQTKAVSTTAVVPWTLRWRHHSMALLSTEGTT
jgi:hypothetical protein